MRDCVLVSFEGERLAFISRSRGAWLVASGQAEECGPKSYRFTQARPARLEAAATARDALRPAESVLVQPATMYALIRESQKAKEIVRAYKKTLRDRVVETTEPGGKKCLQT